MRRIFLPLIVILSTACDGPPTSYAELSRLGPDAIAIDGYSPVSYFSVGKALRGDPRFTVSHGDVIYWLTSAEEVEQFNQDPERYQPAHGGWCSLMLTGSGQMTPANPESFRILDDRLLLFWSGQFNGQPIDGRSNWQSKFDDAAGEQALLAKADQQWQQLLQGGRQKVILFNGDDAKRISAARLERAKKKYD